MSYALVTIDTDSIKIYGKPLLGWKKPKYTNLN